MKEINSSPTPSLKKGKMLKVGITLGDPAGIGPEVALKAVKHLEKGTIAPVLIGRARVLFDLYPSLAAGLPVVEDPGAVADHSPCIFDVPFDAPVPVPGIGSILTGAESKKYIDTAIDLWRGNIIDAIVTGPVHKGFIEKSGTPFTGHTEYMAGAIHEEKPYMMMYSRDYRVLLATTHIPLREVYRHVDVKRLVEVITIGYESIRSIDGGDVVLAVTGFDPHCGDDGAIGDFDGKITAEAVRECRSRGIPVEGPFSADTLFIPENWKKYNLVIVHYHDQGLIPFKLLAFDSGVNVTLGLSLVRTSVDHGTAFDIAGKDKAQFSSMIEAIKIAEMLVLRR